MKDLIEGMKEEGKNEERKNGGNNEEGKNEGEE